MEALSRQEYPAMLASLTPAQAVNVLNERVNRIGKVNVDIANWLQERRKVEQLYVQGLKKLASKQPPDNQGELGIFTVPWKRILSSAENIAESHQLLAQRIEKDVEQPLREFTANNKEMQAMTKIQGNLGAMAKEVSEAQSNSDKLIKKGGKASAQKVEQATSKLETANQQWETQAPFIFETLQALDETRLNHLRDVLTQLETHEADQVERSRLSAEQALNSLLEIETTQEIQNFVKSTMSGKPKLERTSRQSSVAGSSVRPPTSRGPSDDVTEHSGRSDGHGESKMRSRLGTMLGRRRQSIHGGFVRAPSPSRVLSTFSRNSASRDGRPIPSPRVSSSNLRDSPAGDNRLSSLAESPTLSPTSPVHRHDPSNVNGNTNGVDPGSTLVSDAIPPRSSSNAVNGVAALDSSDVQPPPGPTPTERVEAQTDSEGFTVPAAMNDPISQAQQEALEASEQPSFKLDIQKDPIREEDEEAQAALSNVANTLRSNKLATPSRKAGTVRGRRDVRNTIYLPSPDVHLENNIPPSPGIAAGRAAAMAALSSGTPVVANASDTTSIRSGHSLANSAAVKHPDQHHPGLSASIIEAVSITSENGEVKTAKISGEIALTYNETLDGQPPRSSGTIRINNFPNLEAIGPNRIFIHQVSDKPDEFSVDLSHTSKSSAAFTYRVHIEEPGSAYNPLLLRPAWKAQGNDKLALVIEYSLNTTVSSVPVTFNNLVLVATYEGPKASTCQTKPSGTHLKEKSLVYWRLGDVTLTSEWQKVIARFVGAEGTAPQPGHVEARWEVQSLSGGDPLISGLSLSTFVPDSGKGKDKEEADPFADELLASPTTVSPAGHWVDMECAKKLVSGKYEARQVRA